MSTTQKAFCNDDFLPGYYIEKNGDTVQCQVDYKDWNRNPESINVTVNQVQKNLGPADIRGFGVTGYCDYLSADISYHLGPISGGYLPQQYLNKTETKTAFLQILVAGPYCLYEFTSAERPYYFISSQGGPPEELVYQVKQADMLIGEDAQYRTQLVQYLNRENLWEQESGRVNRLGYSKPGLMGLVVRLNEAHTGKKASALAKAKTRSAIVQLDISAGAALHGFPTTFPAAFTSAKFPSTISPVGGLGCRIVMPGHFGAYSIGFGVGYSTLHATTARSGKAEVNESSATWYDIADYTEQVTFSNSIFQTNAYFMYMLPGLRKFNLFGKLGINIDFVRNSIGSVYTSWNASYTAYHSTYPPYSDGDGGRTDETIRLASAAVSAKVAIGAQYGRNWLELAYDTPTELAGNGQPSFKVSGLGVYYIFTVIK